MYVHFSYLFDVITGFSPDLSNQISPLCGTFEALGMHSPTTLFSHRAIRFQRTQNWIFTVSQLRLKCLFGHIVKIWKQCMQ
jgi:hypothetical protein